MREHVWGAEPNSPEASGKEKFKAHNEMVMEEAKKEGGMF